MLNGCISKVLLVFAILFRQADSHTCPSTCDGCLEESVYLQKSCRVYENSASYSDVYEVEDTQCVHSGADDGFEVWGSGTYIANRRTVYDYEEGSHQYRQKLAIHLETLDSPLATAYDPVTTSPSYMLKYSKQHKVYELSNGQKIYIMVIAKDISKTDNLASTLTLPSGWVFQERTLSGDLHVYTPHQSSVVLDNFDNIYIELQECHLHEHRRVQTGLNYIIGISFLIILCCAASFMCIRLYYMRRKRLRKKKLIKSGRVKRYNATQSGSRASPAKSSSKSVENYQDPLC